MRSPNRAPLRKRLALGRLLVGSLLELGIKAYGVAAATSVAVSDAETAEGKSRDAVDAFSTLSEKYHQAKYVVEHREEITAAIDYVNEQAPEEKELGESLAGATATIEDVEATYENVNRATDAMSDWSVFKGAGAFRDAWESRPSLESLDGLVQTTKELSPLIDSAKTLTTGYYESLVAAADNFASDERASTIAVMAVSFLVCFVLAKAVGFVVRRGRPGFVAFALQKLGARVFRRWYVANASFAMGDPLYSAARDRVQRDIVEDPAGHLTPNDFAELERYFVRRHASGDELTRVWTS